jgi:hypothetical protein
MSNKEEILKKLLNNLLEHKLKRLEKREIEQRKDLLIVKDAYNKQGILIKKLCSLNLEPKKQLKRNKTVDKFSYIENKTSNILKNKNKSMIYNEEIQKSKTPNIILRKKRKEQKEKKDDIRIERTPLKSVKKVNNLDTSKTLSYMVSTSNNINKNKKYQLKRTITPNGRMRNKKNINRRPIELRVKLFAIKDENKIMSKLIDNNEIIKTISSFLDEETQYNLFSSNKKFSKYLLEKLMTNYKDFKLRYDLSTSTIKEQINSLQKKYEPDQFTAPKPEITLSHGTEKAIKLLNEDKYNKIFKKELSPFLTEIILVYRIFFQLLKDNSISKIKDDKLFWAKASEHILKSNNGKTGDFFKNSIPNFDFSYKNIYEVKKLINGQEGKIKPSFYSQICGTTGLFVFLIKDILEYIGILQNYNKNVPSIMLSYLKYVGELQNKFELYINNIKKINQKKKI